MKLNYGKGDRLFQAILAIIMFIMTLIFAYPMIYVVSKSISNPIMLAKETLYLLPKGFSTLAFERVFENSRIWVGYGNTLWYVVIGTSINILLTLSMAYVLSIKEFSGRKIIMMLVTFTMLFSGGLIPLYIQINKLGLYDTRWALVLPAAIQVWYLIIARTFFMGIPKALSESARIDGANDLGILFRIILPVSTPIIAVLTIYYAVYHWNSYMPALLYIPTVDKQPVQLFLMKLLIQDDPALQLEVEDAVDKMFVQNQLKYAAIVITMLPILMIYPMFQKYFVKGVMVGSIKG
jgi:putative aldouronate transport system permease protein